MTVMIYVSLTNIDVRLPLCALISYFISHHVREQKSRESDGVCSRHFLAEDPLPQFVRAISPGEVPNKTVAEDPLPGSETS